MPRNCVNQNKIDLDFNELNNTEHNKAKYQSLSNSDCVDIARLAKMSFPNGYRLVRVDTDSEHFNIALLSDHTSEVVYYIDCLVRQDVHLNAKPVTQVFTTVVSHRKVTSGVADEVFRNYLLNQYNIIASDGYHTLEGRDF